MAGSRDGAEIQDEHPIELPWPRMQQNHVVLDFKQKYK